MYLYKTKCVMFKNKKKICKLLCKKKNKQTTTNKNLKTESTPEISDKVIYVKQEKTTRNPNKFPLQKCETKKPCQLTWWIGRVFGVNIQKIVRPINYEF